MDYQQQAYNPVFMGGLRACLVLAFLCFGCYNFHLILSPGMDILQNGDQRFSPLRQRVFHMRRDRVIIEPIHQLASFQFAQRLRQHDVGDQRNAPLDLII